MKQSYCYLSYSNGIEFTVRLDTTALRKFAMSDLLIDITIPLRYELLVSWRKDHDDSVSTALNRHRLIGCGKITLAWIASKVEKEEEEKE